MAKKHPKTISDFPMDFDEDAKNVKTLDDMRKEDPEFDKIIERIQKRRKELAEKEAEDKKENEN